MKTYLLILLSMILSSCTSNEKKYHIYNSEYHSRHYILNNMEEIYYEDLIAWTAQNDDTTLYYMGTGDMKYLTKDWKYIAKCYIEEKENTIKIRDGTKFYEGITPLNDGTCEYFISLIP